MDDYLRVCERAARLAGRLLVQLQGTIQVREKGPKDLVSNADLASQNALREVLLGAFPGHAFVGEEDQPGESQREQISDSGLRWIVDPLDGTTNYVHRLPNYAVSVALCQGDRVLVGTVYDPVLDECFSAREGDGAFLNGTRLRPSGCRELRTALVAASFSANVPRGSLEVAQFVEVLHVSQAVRRLGSAALNLCYVAAGRLDAYWGSSCKTWDVAAGALMLRESGAVLTAADGDQFDLERADFVAAATPELHAELIEALRRAPVIPSG